MDTRPRSTGSAGVLLTPHGTAAALVVDGRPPVPVVLPHDGGSDPDGAFRAVAAVAAAERVRLEVVTVDLSGLLLDAVLHGGPSTSPTVAVRVVPRASTDPALERSPAAAVERLVVQRFTVAGGHDLLGHELCPLDLSQLGLVCEAVRRGGFRHLAVAAAGSPARPDHERAVANAVQAAVPGCDITAGSEFGGQGLAAREATAVLNCSLRPLARTLVDGLEAAAARSLPGVALRVARGDGGHLLLARAAELPAAALGATDAMELRGAAHLAGQDDLRVVLRRPAGAVCGHVRRGLVVVRTGQLPGLGTELVVPTAALAPMPAADVGAEEVAPDRGAELTACVGAATSRPTSWLDEVALIDSTAELERVRDEVEQRATAMATANGARPGTAHVVDLSVVAVPYSPSGTVRIRVRVVGERDIAARPEPVRRAS